MSTPLKYESVATWGVLASNTAAVNTPRLQAALDSGVTKLIMPDSGTYLVDAQLNLPAWPLELCGGGPGTILAGSAAIAGGVVLNCENVSSRYSLLHDFNITLAAASTALMIKNLGTSLRNMTLTCATGVGVEFVNCVGCTIDRVTGNGLSKGVWIHGSGANYVNLNTFIQLAASAGLNAGNTGIYIEGGVNSKGNIFIGADAENCYQNFYNDGRQNIFINLWCEGVASTVNLAEGASAASVFINKQMVHSGTVALGGDSVETTNYYANYAEYQLGGARENSFVLDIADNAGTVKHSIQGDTTSAGATSHADRINGHTQSYTATPTGADAGTAFAGGAKISSAATNTLILDTVAQSVAGQFQGATIELNNTTTALNVVCNMVSRNVNGTTRIRPELSFTNAATGVAFNLTTLAGAGTHISIRYRGFLL